jgi:hypothetical protein
VVGSNCSPCGQQASAGVRSEAFVQQSVVDTPFSQSGVHCCDELQNWPTAQSAQTLFGQPHCGPAVQVALPPGLLARQAKVGGHASVPHGTGEQMVPAGQVPHQAGFG